MVSGGGTLEALTREFTALLAPLAKLTPNTAAPFLAELGLVLTDAQVKSIVPALDKLRGGLVGVIDANIEMNGAIEISDGGAVMSGRLAALDRVGKLISGFTELRAALAALGLPGASTIVDELPQRLFNLLLGRYLQRSAGLPEILELTGVLQRTDHNLGSFDPAVPFFTTSTFDFGRIGGWLSNPLGQLGDLYDWGAPGFDGRKILAQIDRIIAEAGLPSLYDETAVPPTLDLVFVQLAPRTDLGASALELRLNHNLAPGALELGPRAWTVNLGIDTPVLAETKLVFHPGGIKVEPPDATTLTGTAEAKYTFIATLEPLSLLSLPGVANVTAEEIGFSATLRFTPGAGEASFAGGVKRGRLAMGIGNADGFIQKVLGGRSVESNFDLGFGFSLAQGLRFDGSGALEIQLASHLSLGPVDLDALMLSVGVAGGRFPGAITANLKAPLGPLTALVEGIGVEVNFGFAADNRGNFGPLDVALGFRPPKGVGLSLDAGVVRGGGYLYFDPDRGEYAGAIEVSLLEIVTAKAIGIITTKMPDGSDGFSLLIIVSAEFGTGIQLGFGFTLLAVGGLVGLSRTTKLEALMQGVRTGAIQSIMFPKDVIANAPKIISDLRALFPPREGSFLIGPMLKLGWGTPTLISASLGVIIEIPPANITVIGVLKVAIPAEDLPLIVLQVNFAGAIEVDRQRIYFFAALFESRIVFLTIEGEMGLLMAFGDDANFVISVGGFHPSFSPPPLPFPVPRRIEVNLLSTPLSRMRIEAYFAVTANTVQFGARVEVFFGLDEVNVQGHIAFDALIQFSPFHFTIEISASFSVNVFDAGLFSVSITGLLEGPSNWHVKGHGSLSILFFDIDVDFETSWGEERDTLLPPILVMDLAVAEFQKSSNWRALPPATSNLLVSLRLMPDEEAALLLHPLGVLRVTQRALPLGIRLDKVGNQKPSDVNRLTLAVPAGGLEWRADNLDRFAPAQFQDFADADRLSKPAFAPEHAGIDLGAKGDDVRSAAMARRVVRYEEIIIDSNYKRFQRTWQIFAGALFDHYSLGGSVAKSALSQAVQSNLQPFADKITVAPDGYAVALQSNNQAMADTGRFHSEATARDFLTAAIAKDPGLDGQIHVIPSFELAA